MSSQHTTFEGSVATAGTTQLGTIATTEGTHQTARDAANSVVGYNNVSGNNATLVSTIKTANTVKLEALNAAEMAKQKSIAAARETLKASGTAESAGPF
jgi:hypothetical protein